MVKIKKFFKENDKMVLSMYFMNIFLFGILIFERNWIAAAWVLIATGNLFVAEMWKKSAKLWQDLVETYQKGYTFQQDIIDNYLKPKESEKCSQTLQ